MIYTYVISGSAADDQTWETDGIIETQKAGDFHLVPDLAVREAFTRLTGGTAKYGHPGVGCSGPYRITKMVIEEVNGGPGGSHS